MSRSEAEPDHVSLPRAVYDHSVEQYLDAVGSVISSEFEAPIDEAVLNAFALDVASVSAGPVADDGFP